MTKRAGRPKRIPDQEIRTRSIRMTESEWVKANELADKLGTSASNVLRISPFVVDEEKLKEAMEQYPEMEAVDA